ncbi:HAD hydrolase-like protein, partial [bacterium AH-315-E10]|nr:HAD hydrolase-like protein [bacterium AH-315-E10]
MPTVFSMMIRAVLFDFDDTLTMQGAIDFSMLRHALGCPKGTNILEFIESLPIPQQKEKMDLLETIEADAAAQSRPADHAETMLSRIKDAELPMGIITRNSLTSVQRSLVNFTAVTESDFVVIVSRDDPFLPKPDPAGVLHAAAKMNVDVG